MLNLTITKRTNPRLLELMDVHYSQPKGFVGRSICYGIYYNYKYYGHIVAGSATRFLPGRNEFLDTDLSQLNHIVNNIFYHIRKIDDRYPKRNFTSMVIKRWTERVIVDWYNKYNDKVIGFETLVEPPRTGECYRRAGWTKVGKTHGYTCRRVEGQEKGGYSGKRVWDRKNLKPKLVYCYKV